MGGVINILGFLYKNATLIILIGIPIVASFILSYSFTKWWIRVGRKMGFLSKDMNKYNRPKNVVDYGGVFVIISIIIGIYLYVFIKNFIIKHLSNLFEIGIISSIVLLSGFIGALDDFLGWKKGLKPIERILLSIMFSIPLVVYNLGVSHINLPIVGEIDLGILYPLVMVPIGVMGASNALNMIAGYNGLEAIMSMLLFLGIGIKSFLLGKYFISVISAITISSIMGFYIFNKYPAKVFPGNSMMYSLGALFASLIIVGNMEKFGLYIFVLYFAELLLFLRGLWNGVYKENFGIPDKKGCLKEPYKKIYSITHLAIRISNKLFGCAKEVDVVYLLAIIQSIIVLIALYI